MNSLNDLLRDASPAARVVLTSICEAQRRHRLFPSQNGKTSVPVVVGLSGGADSVCLLHALWLLAPHWNLILHAAHLDHTLRDESAADAAFAADLAARLEVPFHLQRLDAGQLLGTDANVEAVARAARYAFLARVADAAAGPPQPATVAVAHHMDDQAKTLLMNLVRGSGLRGLGAMPWIRETHAEPAHSDGLQDSGAVRLVRPLLALRRSQILDYLQDAGLSHVEDPTNQDTTRLRNRIRYEMLPHLAQLNPQIVETLARSAHIMHAELDRAEAIDRAVLDKLTIETVPGRRHVLNRAGLRGEHLATQRGVLRLACEQLGLDTRELGFEHVDDVLRSLHEDGNAVSPQTLAGHVMWTALPADRIRPAVVCLYRVDELPVSVSHPLLVNLSPNMTLPLAIEMPSDQSITAHWALRTTVLPRDAMPFDWRRNPDPWRAFLDADCVQSPALTVPSSGMRITPLGMPGQSKSLGDTFTDRKTPPVLRSRWPILVEQDDGAVIWLCGHTIAHEVRVTPATKRILMLEWHPTEALAAEAPKIQNQCAQM